MATFYIDPSAAVNGSGTEASPFNAWTAVTWTAGNTYLQKAGTTYLGQLAPGGSGTSGNPITIGRYGEGANPIITHTAAGVFLSARQFINIFGIDAVGCTTHGFHIRTNGSNISTINLRGCVARNNGNNGFFLDGQVLTATLTGVRFIACEAHNNGEHGYDTLGIIKTIRWERCKASYNGRLVAGHGFSLHPFISNNITSGWTLSGGTVYMRTLSASESVQKFINLTDGVTLTKEPGATTAVALNRWDQSGTTLYVNLGVDANTRTTAWRRAEHGPFHYYDCESWGNYTDPVAGEGHGFAADDATSDAHYYRCKAWDNTGAGFQCQYTDRVSRNACISYRNALSNFRTTGHTDTLDDEGCTSADCVQHGFFYDDPFTAVTVKNSLAYGNDLFGFIAAASGVTGTNNATFGNGNTVSNVTNTNAVTADPLLTSDYKPMPGSPLLGAGTHLGYTRDIERKQRPNPPSIGAYDTATLRTPE